MQPVGEEAYGTLVEFFQYDKSIPLGSRIVSTWEDSLYVGHKIVFNGVRDSRVPAYLAIPKKGAPPYPCIFLIHSGVIEGKAIWWGDDVRYYERFVAPVLLSAGFAVMTLDLQYHGERTMLNDFVSGTSDFFRKQWRYRTLDWIVQSTIEHRQAIDYLSSRQDIDTSRIGVLGSSGGSLVATYLAAVEPRVKSIVLCTLPLGVFDSRAPDVIAPWHFFRGTSNKSIIMMMSRGDPFYTVEEAERFFALIPAKAKDIVFYEVKGHHLLEDYAQRATQWFLKYLR